MLKFPDECQRSTESKTAAPQQRPLVYVSGPYRAPTLQGILRNVYTAWEASTHLWRAGAAVICPHTNTIGMSEVFGDANISAEACIEGDLVMIERCDAIYMLPGYPTSTGAVIELAHAKLHNIPIYYSLSLLRTMLEINHPLSNNKTNKLEFLDRPLPASTIPSANPKDAAGQKKTPFHLVPESANRQEAEVMRLGADKYGAYNWRSDAVKASVYVSALRRHMAAWFDGENDDLESGLSHLAHARANLGILLDATHVGKLIDDRPVSCPNEIRPGSCDDGSA